MSDAAGLVLHSARTVQASGIEPDAWLLIEDGAVTATGSGGGWPRRPGLEVVDAGGLTATPGFLDLHVHGGAGASFEDGPNAIRAALDLHRSRGTTRSLISLVSAPIARLERSVAAVASLAAEDPLVLGAHLEGPFLAPSRRGAHDPAALAAPEGALVTRLLEAAAGALRQITIAPELPGATAAIERFAAAGVIVAVGHTAGDAETARSAFDHGARLLTHAFNAMPGIHHRDPGPVVAAFEDSRVTLELVLDGEHVDPRVVALAFRAAPGRIALVTDAMAAAGAPDGSYRLGALDVDVAAGRAVLRGTATLAGSTLTQDRALRLGLAAGLDERVVVEALTATPARVLGRADLGALTPGGRADIVLLDADRHVQAVWAEGRLIAGSVGEGRPRSSVTAETG
ncbi:amidohydrolase family protein [Rathayibacter sp. VKM Ac-2760]|uniref:N-acetylglucosamine-6-phosphate deacetylase n=1 Tax=Rathayibacter sp. VKM Ac-2760 TaxID=2609253 RepID=UPI00131765DB|nr:amidohydrolase family protein [Rathayibacter sp. VKM Ac-2760]QHC61032.1 amidohydrolase family protein [Rathayibacter sp. VKM Ac-2760]